MTTTVKPKKKPKPPNARPRKMAAAKTLARAAQMIAKQIAARTARDRRYTFRPEDFDAVWVAGTEARKKIKGAAKAVSRVAQDLVGEGTIADPCPSLMELSRALEGIDVAVATARARVGHQYKLAREGCLMDLVPVDTTEGEIMRNALRGLQALQRDHGDGLTVKVSEKVVEVSVLKPRFPVVRGGLRAHYGPFVLRFRPEMAGTEMIKAVPATDCPVRGSVRPHQHIISSDGGICRGNSSMVIDPAYRDGRLWDIFNAVSRLLDDPNYSLETCNETIEAKCSKCKKWSPDYVKLGAKYGCRKCFKICPRLDVAIPDGKGVIVRGKEYHPDAVVYLNPKTKTYPVLGNETVPTGYGVMRHPGLVGTCHFTGRRVSVCNVPDAEFPVGTVADAAILLPDGKALSLNCLDLIDTLAPKGPDRGQDQAYSTAYWRDRIKFIPGLAAGYWARIDSLRTTSVARKEAGPTQAAGPQAG